MEQLNCIGCGKKGCDGKTGCEYYDSIHPDSDRQANDYEGEKEVSEDEMISADPIEQMLFDQASGKDDFTTEEVQEAKRLTSERN